MPITLRAIRVRDAVSTVRSNFPPMTRLRHKKTKELYIMGCKFGMSSFWIMQVDPAKKGVESALRILDLFEIDKYAAD